MQEVGKFKMDTNVIPNNWKIIWHSRSVIIMCSLKVFSLEKLVVNLPDDAFKYTSEKLKTDETKRSLSS